MNHEMCYQIWQLFIIVVCYVLPTSAETFSECNPPDKFNRYVVSQTNCAHYIYCDGEDSFMGECLDDNYFNEEAGNCDDRDTVVCKVGMIVAEQQDQAETGTSSSVMEISDTDALTTAPTIITFPTQMITVNSHTPVELLGNTSPQCPRSADPIYLPNARTCTSYYICHFGIAIPMSCPAQYSFSASSGRCERQELVQCAVNRPTRIDCIRGVYDFMPHPDNCEYYYFCNNGFLMIFQCPHQFSWHYERKTCVHKSQMKCFSNTAQSQNFGFW